MTIEEEIIKNLSDKYGLTKEQIREIVKYQFKFLHQCILLKETKPIYLESFGSFRYSEAIANHAKRSKDKSSDEVASDINLETP